ncbi:uncharacterized protein C18orf19 homolog A isoform X2 [Palaemon carinicauda]|uniref:uncharacterized protein C18orf19 homolog A isoform X2 n=1 Tax=Palaemon carinicauda TaxID=392227 RepID=UPI0035B6A8E7
MPLRGSRQLYLPALQIMGIVQKSVEHMYRSRFSQVSLSWLPICNGHQSYRVYSSSCTWHHRKHHRCSLHYHSPFTISKMTGGTFVIPQLSPSAITPIPLWSLPDTTFKECHVRLYSTKPPSQPSTPVDENQNEIQTSKLTSSKSSSTVQNEGVKEEKLSLVQKFKLMYKQYWYVLIPVHVATSLVWYGSFFIAAKSGLDIVPWLEWMGASEKILSHLRNSNAGYYALAYAMYKIATPARYTVTIGGTTLSINYLKKRGYIKPVPSSEQLKEMYEAVFGKLRSLLKRPFKKEKDEPASPSHDYVPV